MDGEFVWLRPTGFLRNRKFIHLFFLILYIDCKIHSTTYLENGTPD